MGPPPSFLSYIIDASKEKITPIAIPGEEMDAYGSTISPDGKLIVFNKISDGIPIMPVSDFIVGEKSATNILNVEYPDNSLLAWSPDSSRIAIIGIRNNIASINIYDLANNSLKTVFEYYEASLGISTVRDRASWSSDGKKIAFSLEFVNEQSSQSDVFSYDIDRNKLARITNTPDLTEHYPSWHSGDNVLTYITSDNAVDDMGWSEGKLSFSNAEGTCKKILSGLIGIASPSWSPDGTQLAYISLDGVEVLDIKNVISSEYLSSEKLCQTLN